MDFLPPLFPGIRFVAQAENLGFSKANNLGWRMARGDYILFLNPDTILPEDSLQQSLSAMKANSRIGALGIRMVDGSGQYLPESKRGFPSPKTSFFKLSGLIHLFPSSPVFARYYLGHLSPLQSQEVEVLAGAYMMVQKTVLEATGGFDERFFMYGEDVDLSYRICLLGYKNWWLADSTIIHFKGESTRKDAKYIALFYKAMVLFVEKHYGRQAGWYTFLLQAAIRARAALSFAARLLRPVRATKTRRPPAIVIAGGPAAAGEVQSILEKNHYPVASVHIAGGPLLPLIEHRPVDEIIYCTGTASYKDIIHCLQELPSRVISRFHAAGSCSIVGSHTKNTGGEALGDMRAIL
jgi:GT2 family glycosyltransferase